MCEWSGERRYAQWSWLIFFCGLLWVTLWTERDVPSLVILRYIDGYWGAASAVVTSSILLLWWWTLFVVWANYRLLTFKWLLRTTDRAQRPIDVGGTICWFACRQMRRLPVGVMMRKEMDLCDIFFNLLRSLDQKSSDLPCPRLWCVIRDVCELLWSSSYYRLFLFMLGCPQSGWDCDSALQMPWAAI